MSGDEYVNNMLKDSSHWVDGAEKGFLEWGIMTLWIPDRGIASVDI